MTPADALLPRLAVSRTRVLFAAIFLLYWAAASLTTASLMYRWGFRENERRFDLTSMLEYRAERPFVYRTLIPILVNEVSRSIPDDRKRQLTDHLDSRTDLRTQFFRSGGPAWTPEFSFAYYLIYYLDFGCLLCALLALRATAQQLPHASALAVNFMPLAFCVLLPTAFLVGGYFYDFPELLFLALAYLAAFRRWHLLLLLIVPIASANKETAVLLPALVSPILWGTLGRNKALLYLTGATVFGAAAALGVRSVLDLSRGAPVILHLSQNFWFWLHPSSYLQFTDMLAPGIPFPKPANVLFLVPLVAMVTVGWKVMTALERRLLLVSALVNLPLALLFGAPAEFRNLSLMFVPILIACVRFFSNVPAPGALESEPAGLR